MISLRPLKVSVWQLTLLICFAVITLVGFRNIITPGPVAMQIVAVEDTELECVVNSHCDIDVGQTCLDGVCVMEMETIEIVVVRSSASY